MDVTPVKTSFYDEEIQEITDALYKSRGNQTEAAKLLGIDRTTLWRKMRRPWHSGVKERYFLDTLLGLRQSFAKSVLLTLHYKRHCVSRNRVVYWLVLIYTKRVPAAVQASRDSLFFPLPTSFYTHTTNCSSSYVPALYLASRRSVGSGQPRAATETAAYLLYRDPRCNGSNAHR